MIQTKVLEFINDNSHNFSKENWIDLNQLLNDKKTIRDKDKTVFYLPISYLENKYKIQETVKTDLELTGTENKNKTSLYNHVFNPESYHANLLMGLWNVYYTVDTEYLKDTQYFIKNFKHVISTRQFSNLDNINKILKEVDNETGFCEKYKYINTPFFKGLNNNGLFLQLLTIYNLTSPVMSLLIPILILIVPFFILRIRKVPITVKTYISILMKVIQHHGIGKAILEFSNVGMDRKFFIIISVIFYFINIYQNILSCYTFYKNIYKIRECLLSISKFISYTIDSITNINKYCKSSYLKFANKNKEIQETLIRFNREIKSINLDKIYLKQVGKIGNTLKAFYKLFKNDCYYYAIKYGLYLDGYVENILTIQQNILEKNMNYCKFTNGTCKFNEGYFAPLKNNKPIKNTYKFSNNIIITGPNASGKTTILKTTLFNIILSQQLGIGFYKKASINPYNYLHSYINIPDTSDRDSLFQAEARRCKEILDSVSLSGKDERHFCIFDEIYSGTNPSEAIASAYSFLNYIAKYKNFEFILTTHYVSLCNILKDNDHICNKQMKINGKEYTYILINGISTVRGGLTVLNDLELSTRNN